MDWGGGRGKRENGLEVQLNVALSALRHERKQEGKDHIK